MARRIEVEVTGDARGLQNAFGRASRYTNDFRGQMAKVGDTMVRTGRSMTRGLTLPIVGVGVAAGKLGLDFGQAMTKISALVGASDKQMRQYEKGVLQLAKTTPQGPKALAEALYFVTSSGFEGAEALQVLEASAKAAAAGLGDTTLVADAVTSAVNAYGIENLKAAEATDVLLATVREGKAEPEELAGAIGRVIAPAEAMGVAFDEVGGALAGLSLTGLDAEEAVTALRGTLSSFLKPSKQATDFLEANGMSMAELRRQIDDKGLLATLQMLRNRFGDNKEALAKLFPNVRALNGFLALTGRNAEKNAAVMDKVTKATGDTSEAFAKASEDAKFRLQVAWSQVQVAMISAAAIILPLVGQLASKVAGLAQWFEKLSPSAQKTILVLAGVAAALGPVVGLVGKLILTVRALSVALLFLAANPLGAAIVAAVALGAAIVIAYKRSETFRAIVTRAIEIVRAHWQKLLFAIGPFGPALFVIIRHFGTFREIAVRAFGFAAAAARSVVSAVQAIIGVVESAINAFGRLISIARSAATFGNRAPGGVGFKAPTIRPGNNAAGTSNWRGGLSWVGERGPELVNLPRGSQVIPNHRLRAAGAGGTVQVVVVGGDRSAIEWLRRTFDDYSRANGGRKP